MALTGDTFLNSVMTSKFMFQDKEREIGLCHLAGNGEGLRAVVSSVMNLPHFYIRRNFSTC